MSFYGMPILLVWICLSFLLAIIGDAYTEVKDEFGDAGDYFSETAQIFGHWVKVRPFILRCIGLSGVSYVIIQDRNGNSSFNMMGYYSYII